MGLGAGITPHITSHHITSRRGFAFAVQPHREVRPESGLVGIVEHIVVNKKVTALTWYRLMSKHESEWPYGIPKRDGEEGGW